MIEHNEWVGRSYESLELCHQRIVIAGYSHWGSGDNADFTRTVIKEVCAGNGHAFFSAIRGYFDYDDDRAFWDRVVFFNTVPSLIGDADERYAYGTEQQLSPIQARVLRIVEQHRPDKIVCFTSKGWKLWPKFSGSQTSEGIHFLDSEQQVEWGTYLRQDSGETYAFGLRHPQFASNRGMHEAVKAILAFGPATLPV